MSVKGADCPGSLTSDLTSILRIPGSYDTPERYMERRNVPDRHSQSREINQNETPGNRGDNQRANNGREVDFQGFGTRNGNQDLDTDEVPQTYTQTRHSGIAFGNRGDNHGANNRNEVDFEGFSTRSRRYEHNTTDSGSEVYRQTIHTELNRPQPTRQREASLPRPRYPDYANKAARIASYRSWSSILKSVEEMAEGGFFHATSSNGNDCVRCFQCGIGLRNWDPEDDPWVEHARWSSKCPYLRQKKGQSFVDLVQAAVRQAQIEETLSQNSGANGTRDDIEADTPSSNGSTDSGHKPSATEKKNPLLTTAAQSVLDMGYLPRIVKRAVDEVLKEKGWSGMTGMNIFGVVLRFEEELQRDNKEGKAGNEALQRKMKVPSNDFVSRKLKTISKSKDYKTLQTENEDFKEQKTCKICCEETVSIVFLPCGHLVCCAQCSPALKDCPVCRTTVKGTVRVCLA